MAAAVPYLAADARSFVTGQALLAEGGLLARLPRP